MKVSFTRKLLLLSILVWLPLEAAWAQLYLTPQVRPRAEWRNGYQSLPNGQDGAFFVSQRSRLTLDYKQDKVQMRFSLQDVRVWGNEVHLKDVPSTAMHEAWGEVALSDKFAVRLGRQEFVYNNDRLLGNVDWVQQARSHDGMVLKARWRGISLDAGGAFNQEKEALFDTHYSMNNYKVLGFLWAKKQLGEQLSLSAMHISDGFQRPDTVGGVYFRHTYGLDLNYKHERVQFNGSLYRQSGEHGSGKKIAAYLAVGEATYTLQPFQFTLGTTYLSGMAGHEHKVRSFNTLYATNHKYYGFMDYFINVPADTRQGGLHDNYLKTTFSPSASYNLSLDYHYFALAKNLRASETHAGTSNRYLGSELDAVLQYKHSDQIQFSIGYSSMFAGSSMAAIKPGDASAYADWGWVMVNFQPRILLKSFEKE
ncbi:alginate export family protein [Pontibacter sp. BT731]|uniref:alginate export family protein n=1 Tax=Pontibacter coccineus TaxID=3063328 RepID=UPI0026E26E47|nr:alginate export family protein [Pontibacter sp. BT731]MDO6392183.1 alginate export family protein [Pontibacter sp. BT731]